MKIKSILIANRGEIAIRIIRTAKKMKIKTFVIKTAKEPKALYLNYADEIIDFSNYDEEIPEFLNIDKLIATAKEKKISAVHPGYGYLSENPYFAQKCKEAGIVFIGPSPEAIYKMGNKTIAKEIARKKKIPLIEGSPGAVLNFQDAKKIALKIGFPIIIKAAAGGGGRGMRIVNEDSQLEKSFRLASDEALKAFGDASVFIEKYITNPKHIEFQILADNFGNVIHLGERDCTVQRKHQKLIEQAPSHILNDKLRTEMGDASIEIAKSVNYSSAGTVEFLIDSNGNYYFIEMNTRIQVEHPVTEMITGIDLIEQQIKVAENKKIDYSQKDIKLKGWAIEFRINAEDPQNGFAPDTGTLEKVKFPINKNIRIETGVESDSIVTSHFDSMVAKLIVWGKTREEMIKNSIEALDNTIFVGVKTTIPFHKAVLHNNEFVNGEISTDFIQKQLGKPYYEEQTMLLAASFLAAKEYSNLKKQDIEEMPDYNKESYLNPWVLNKRNK